MKKFLTCVILFITVISISQAKHQIKVALCFDDSSAVRWKVEKHFISEKVQEYGGLVHTSFSGGDVEVQKDQIRAMIAKKVDVIVIVASDGKEISPIVKEANKKKIKVIAYDRLIPDCHLEYYISFDNVEIGRKMAESCLASSPSGNYVLLGGPRKDNNSILLHQGEIEALNDKVEKNEVDIIDDIYLAAWTEEAAYSTMVAILQKEPEINVVLAANDVIAQGALKALQEYNQNTTLLTGQDAELEAIKRVERGEQSITVYKPIKNLAKICAELVVDISSLHESRVTRNIKTVNNGKENISTIYLPSILVTQSNTSTIRREIDSYSKYY